MTTTLSQDAMRKLITRHADAEVEQNIEKLMATLAPEPYYEFHPHGLRVTTREAVAEMYRRLLPGLHANVVSARNLNTWCNDEALCTDDEYVIRLSTGEERTMSGVSVFTFEGDLVKGERTYMEKFTGEWTNEILGEDFATLPGVSRL